MAEEQGFGVLWYTEWLSSLEAHVHGIKRIIYDGRTKYQRVTLAETGSFGLTLFLDGYAQSSEYDEFVYHESLVHPAMLTHPHPEKVLVIGGGEGATLREVLKHPSVKRAVMVDIDEELVEIVKRYMWKWHRSSFDDPRVELLFMDGKKFVEETSERFDVIILDLTDPVSGTPGVHLYTKEFYETIYDKLTPQGVMVTQATSTRYNVKAFSVINNTVASVFPVARPYKVFVATFYSEWGFALGSKGRDPLKIDKEEISRRLQSLDLRYLDLETFYYLFHIPKYIREEMQKYTQISTRDNPLQIEI
ncbi:polyamine aminopropyltransferase [Thermofilum pendens]|uniref:Polyamine aminopropyltransferase n=1 Tax=Thermofilum pendens (strain DSM 2475 / Hrk 5) TaxID=368408 RepID=A1RWF0_THEPD|nr:polyamine aminopropyltransferase [Thermofilum pendens]ABL77530.1 spermine synthase / spermidine synthase [Thermofilum pendens Hrk 5]